MSPADEKILAQLFELLLEYPYGVEIEAFLTEFFTKIRGRPPAPGEVRAFIAQTKIRPGDLVRPGPAKDGKIQHMQILRRSK